MVLCRFFQQGNCRFASKCTNEHFDVRQILKTDVESAINGKQWPFSCYGPFKDKPCIPDFIQDQSFEEVRLLCYEAKQKNFLDQFHQQFTKEALEANNKMKALLQANQQAIEVVCKVYDTPTNENGSTSQGVFSKTTNAAPNAGNVFGGGFNSMASTNVSNGNIFGGASNPSAGNIFGGGAVAGSNSLFSAQQPNSIFSQQAGKPPNSIFGGGNQQPTLSVFGQPANASGGSIFAQAAQETKTIASNNLFAQQAPGQQQSTLTYGSAFQPQPPKMFGQTNAFGGPNTPGFSHQGGNSMFDQSQPNSGGIFDQQQPQGIFAQAAANQPTGLTFGQVTQQSQTPNAPPSGFFQQTIKATQPPSQPQSPLSSLYSRMADLSAEDIEAFKAEKFPPNRIPCVPPPIELVN